MNGVNLTAAWVGILFGFLSGAIHGVLFHKDNWLGGYSTWARRMTRLGHISFFGLGFINLAYALTISQLNIPGNELSSALLIVGALTMPLVCYLSAFKKTFRHLFPVPVISLVLGVSIFIITGGVL
jgi:hypothetical protein